MQAKKKEKISNNTFVHNERKDNGYDEISSKEKTIQASSHGSSNYLGASSKPLKTWAKVLIGIVIVAVVIVVGVVLFKIFFNKEDDPCKSNKELCNDSSAERDEGGIVPDPNIFQNKETDKNSQRDKNNENEESKEDNGKTESKEKDENNSRKESEKVTESNLGDESKSENSDITENETKSEIESEENIDEEQPTIEELKEIYKSNFKINSNVGTLTQTMMKSKQNIIIKSNNLLDYTFIKAKVDTYIISEIESESGEDVNFYQKKITTSVVINSLCSTSEGTDCQDEPYLDLTEKYEKENNLRNVNQEPNIEDLTIPLCLIEHTDTNIILSINCPRTLESNLKSLIINAFKGIKPQTIKGANDDKEISDTKIETKEDKIYINSFSKVCEEYENSDKTCETNTNIVTDKDGNFISCNKKLKTETNSKSNEYIYDFEDISHNLDSSNYKSNLESILETIKNYMEKETYITANSYNELLEEQKKTIRNLKEEMTSNAGKQENNYFCTEYGMNEICFGLSDNILNGDGDISETSSNINKTKELSNNKVNSNLTKTINEFKILSNAVNGLGTELFKKINVLLLELEDKINLEFTNLDELLSFKDLSAIYDSTFAIGGLKEFPYTIVSSSKNVYTNIKTLSDDLIYSIDDYKTILKNSITSFLSNSHGNINNIFNKLKELTSTLSSKKSKVANIATYYGLNNTNTSFISIIENAREILENYYIEEKNKIEPLLNSMFDKFSKDSDEKIKNGHFIFDNITNRLEDKSVTINRGEEDDIRSVIDNLYNTKILENQFITKIVENMKKNIIQNNGYFETQKVLEDNKNLYYPVCESALISANNLVKNEYIDEIFDEIMKYFREQLIVILKNIEKSKIEKFPFITNVLGDSFKTLFDELDSYFKNEKININNLMKNENNNFMNSIKEKINSFLKNNQKNLEELIEKIYNNLSKLNLNNIDIKYNEMLTYTMNNITNIIDYNYQLLIKYMNDIKSTTHRTKAIQNKLTIFTNKMTEISSFINLSLKNGLVNKYKNIINQIRTNLQSIKSNSFIKKYYEQKDLSIFKSHIEKYINPLFSTLDDYISDKLFNTKYLPLINNYIKKCNDKINAQFNNYKNLYNPISKLAYTSDSTNDIYYLHSWRCCKSHFIFCWRHGTCYEYRNKVVGSTNNYKLIKSIIFSNYAKDFDKKYNEIYTIFSKNVVSYNNIVLNLGNEFQQSINNYSNKKVDYLNSLSEKAKTFLKNELNMNVLKSSYNYYKTDLKGKLPTELKSILEQWKSTYNTAYEEINRNINKFKYPIGEFGTLATIYYAFYYQNISYSYSDSVIEQRKNDFNYTIKYYYNLFLSKVNKTYTYILNNIPVNEKPFDDILNYQISQIKNSYNEIIDLII